MPGSRTIKTLACLLAAMTMGAFILLALEQSPTGSGPVVALSARSTAGGENIAVIDQILQTRIPLQTGKWLSIVIHDSVCDLTGNVVSGSHFLIHGDNSTCPDGMVQATARWQEQADGAHVFLPGSNYNSDTIGICLVGDFALAQPTPAQTGNLLRLVRGLRLKFAVPGSRVYLHSDLTGQHCPGGQFPVTLLPSLRK